MSKVTKIFLLFFISNYITYWWASQPKENKETPVTEIAKEVEDTANCVAKVRPDPLPVAKNISKQNQHEPRKPTQVPPKSQPVLGDDETLRFLANDIVNDDIVEKVKAINFETDWNWQTKGEWSYYTENCPHEKCSISLQYYKTPKGETIEKRYDEGKLTNAEIKSDKLWASFSYHPGTETYKSIFYAKDNLTHRIHFREDGSPEVRTDVYNGQIYEHIFDEDGVLTSSVHRNKMSEVGLSEAL
ncbi:MAG: hypothetical protein KDD33_10690 [Bdellovibrionales bacterium]|nr:hypothetical protein [Bdellovibrionales bacterium]